MAACAPARHGRRPRDLQRHPGPARPAPRVPAAMGARQRAPRAACAHARARRTQGHAVRSSPAYSGCRCCWPRWPTQLSLAALPSRELTPSSATSSSRRSGPRPRHLESASCSTCSWRTASSAACTLGDGHAAHEAVIKLSLGTDVCTANSLASASLGTPRLALASGVDERRVFWTFILIGPTCNGEK